MGALKFRYSKWTHFVSTKNLWTVCIHLSYTPFKYRFSGKLFVKSGSLFDNVQKAVHFNHEKTEIGQKPSIANKKLLRKYYKKHFLSFFRKTKLTQTSGSAFADTIEQIERSQIGKELITIVDSFLDGRS